LVLGLFFGINGIKSDGLPENQAEAIVNSQKALTDSSLVTKADLRADLMPIKYTLALLVAGVGAIFMRLFFPH
jgi:hypothetical protein